MQDGLTDISLDQGENRQLSPTLLRNICDSASAGLMVLSPTLELIFINPAAENMLGVSESGSQRIAVMLAANQWLDAMVRGCIGTGNVLSVAEATLVVGTRSLTVRADLSPLVDESAGSAGVIIMVSDLSHQRGAQQSFGRDDEEMTLGLSPAGLAHEIKNPLTGIKGAAELLAPLMNDNPRGRQYCELIVGGVDRIADLVEQVLSLSGPQRLRRESINVHQVLHQALRTAALYPTTPAGITLEQEFDPSLPEVMADQAALERVFLNLVRNAVEAIKGPGRIRLRTRMETEFHTSSHGKRHRFLRVEVADSGKNLSDGEMAQLFTPFFTTKPKGTGLGLVLSQQIVRLHGGKLWAIRTEDLGGMSFRLTLPLAEDGRES